MVHPVEVKWNVCWLGRALNCRRGICEQAEHQLCRVMFWRWSLSCCSSFVYSSTSPETGYICGPSFKGDRFYGKFRSWTCFIVVDSGLRVARVPAFIYLRGKDPCCFDSPLFFINNHHGPSFALTVRHLAVWVMSPRYLLFTRSFDHPELFGASAPACLLEKSRRFLLEQTLPSTSSIFFFIWFVFTWTESQRFRVLIYYFFFDGVELSEIEIFCYLCRTSMTGLPFLVVSRDSESHQIFRVDPRLRSSFRDKKLCLFHAPYQLITLRCSEGYLIP